MATAARSSARSGTALVAVLVVACGGGQPRSTDSASPAGEARRVPAAAATTADPVAAIAARVDSIDGWEKRHPERLVMFARVPGSEKLVVVKDSAAWPETIESAYYALTDDSGRVLMHREMPYSESGDWAASFTHYFAPDGHTILYHVEVAGFGSGCGDVLRESKRVYYSPAFSVLDEDVRYTDNDGRKISAENCYRRSETAPAAKRGITELPLVAGFGAPIAKD